MKVWAIPVGQEVIATIFNLASGAVAAEVALGGVTPPVDVDKLANAALITAAPSRIAGSVAVSYNGLPRKRAVSTRVSAAMMTTSAAAMTSSLSMLRVPTEPWVSTWIS